MLLFARPREIAGAGRFELEVEEGATAATVFDQLCRDHPGLERTRDRLRVAVDQGYAAWETPVSAGAELAFIPPTAGG